MGDVPAPSRHAPSLLEQVRGLIERTYDHRSGLGPLAPFLVGDDGYRRLAARWEIVRRVGSAAGAGAQLLLRGEADGSLRASLYYPDRMIRALEASPPARSIDGRNIGPFAAFIEEIDHLLLVAVRARRGVPVSLLELEIHANVSKELVIRHFLARLRGGRRAPPGAVDWVRFHLFEGASFSDPDPQVRQRYQDAARFALRYLRRLDRLAAAERVADLRRFSRLPHHAKLALLRAA